MPIRDPNWDPKEPTQVGVYCANCGEDSWWLERHEFLPDARRYSVSCEGCATLGETFHDDHLLGALQAWQEHYTDQNGYWLPEGD